MSCWSSFITTYTVLYKIMSLGKESREWCDSMADLIIKELTLKLELMMMWNTLVDL